MQSLNHPLLVTDVIFRHKLLSIYLDLCLPNHFCLLIHDCSLLQCPFLFSLPFSDITCQFMVLYCHYISNTIFFLVIFHIFLYFCCHIYVIAMILGCYKLFYVILYLYKMGDKNIIQYSLHLFDIFDPCNCLHRFMPSFVVTSVHSKSSPLCIQCECITYEIVIYVTPLSL